MSSTAIRRMVGLGFVAVALLSAPAVASQDSVGTFQVSTTVPTACWVDHAVAADALGAMQGQVTEGCNSASGYIVSATYRALDASERARLIYGDRMFELSSLGQQEVRREYGPRIQKIAYRFDEIRLDAPLTLSLTIQPI